MLAERTQLDASAIYEMNRGAESSPPVTPVGRGVAECPWTDMPGWRMFVALNEASVCVSKGYLQEGGDEVVLRSRLTMGLLEWESGTGFLAILP
ncbi:MAG: hypothetical protein ACR2GQ_05020 [Gemmatimonadota bacterium]